MNISIISVTEQGKIVSDKLYESLNDNPLILSVTQYHKNVKNTIDNVFDKSDCIIGIMASGIMIRSIAPYVTSKLSDPAVLLIDDNANFVISLLSGHFGGANDLTKKISSIIDATPVITTSTDVNNKVGIDSIAKRYYCNLINPQNIKYINKALIEDRKVTLKLPHIYSYILDDEIRSSYEIEFDNTLAMIVSQIDDHEVLLKPKNIVMGIGARRNINADKVLHAINASCELLNIPPSRIDSFATAEVKQYERGIVDNVNALNKTLTIISMDEIKDYNNNECSESDFVMKKFGVKGVCEPCSLIANGQNAHLIFKKTAYDGVTIAISIDE